MMTEMTETKSNKKIRRRRTLAAVLLVVSLLASIIFMDHFLCIPATFDQNRVLLFHKEPADSIDVLLIGSSTTYSGFSSAYAYDQFGFTSYPYAIGGSTCNIWKPALQDALRTQHPKLIVVDVFGGGYDLDLVESRNSQVYTIMTHTPLSREKIETAKELSSKIDRTTTASLLLPFIKYHNSVPANLMDLKDRLDVASSGPSPLKGIETLTRTRELADVDDISFTDETAPLDEKTEAVINEFMDYCRSKDLNVLFVKYPTVLTKNDPDELQVNLRANRILEMADEAGFHTLNMQKYFHEIGLKEREDYYNHGHTNTRGQKKVTSFLGGYIQNELGIAPSDLSDSVRTEWDDSVRYYGAYVEMSEELINKGDPQPMGDSPKLVRELKKRLD